MIPELYICCNGRECFLNKIKVRQYKRYAELMQKNKGDKLADTIFFDLKIIQEIFENKFSVEELKSTEAAEIISLIGNIHFIMQEVVSPKFLELLDDDTEKEESAFDEYDRVEGYEEENDTENIWGTCEENTDRIIQIAIKLLRESYTACLEADIISLLDFIKFEVRTINENRGQSWHM